MLFPTLITKPSAPPNVDRAPSCHSCCLKGQFQLPLQSRHHNSDTTSSQTLATLFTAELPSFPE